MNAQTPTDVLNTILSFLDNLELAGLAMTCTFWDQYTRNRVIPIDPSFAPLFDIHFGPYRRFPGKCPCSICRQLDDIDLAGYNYNVRITKHLRGPYNPNWREYVHEEDHWKVDPDKYQKAILVTTPKLRISRAFARWLKKRTCLNAKKSDTSTLMVREISFNQNPEPDTDFAVIFPIYGSLYFTYHSSHFLYCCDANSPYYDHIYIGGSFTAKFSYGHIK
nr:hypothetical protein K-LCC10_0027 [Kaumoebavirus]